MRILQLNAQLFDFNLELSDLLKGIEEGQEVKEEQKVENKQHQEAPDLGHLFGVG